MTGKWTHRLLGSCFFAGYIPFAPGTVGALIGALASWFLIGRLHLGLQPYLLICGGLTFFGFALARNCERHFGANDPQPFILDEVIGQIVTFVGISYSWKAFLMGFLYFRFFDIIKPYPIRESQAIENGAGIVMDDLAAGLLSCVLLHATLLLYHGCMNYLAK